MVFIWTSLFLIYTQCTYCSRTELTAAIPLCFASSHITDPDGAGGLQQHNTRQTVPHAHTLASSFYHRTLKEMTSPVNQAMLDAYVLMVLVMGTFFLYFCGMVWAFCNPKLSGAEEECGTDRQVAESTLRPSAAEELTRSTFVKFWDDTVWRGYSIRVNSILLRGSWDYWADLKGTPPGTWTFHLYCSSDLHQNDEAK